MMKLLKKINLKGLLPWRFLLFFFSPWILLIFFGAFLVPYFVEYLKEIIAFGCLTILLFGLSLLSPRGIKNFIFIFFFSVISLLGFIKLSFYYLYGVKLSASALFVIFETNANETSEFLGAYLSLPIIFLLVVFLTPLTLFLLRLFKHNTSLIFQNFSLDGFLKNAMLLCLVIGSGAIIHWKFINENLLLQSVHSYQEYKDTKEVLKTQLAQPFNAIVSDAKSLNEDQTYVIVLGESTSSWHMQLYGYLRETSPKLTEIRDELIVFDSVISPHVHTILALQKIMTFANYENAKPSENASIIQLANAAGFETYWISNQQPVGIHESVSTLIANAAKNKQFVATEGYKYTIHDETLLPVLNQVLSEKKKKKLIFLHLIGTHVAYHKRYPKAFNYFTDKDPTKSDEANEYINTYDNANRYNDFIVRSIIEKVRALNTNSFVAYFADHGDEVHDINELIGHNEYVGSRPMYEIPFLVWFSEKYKNPLGFQHRKSELENRRYNLEDFIYSFADLTNITFSKMDSTRSIFNSGFIKRKRLIKKGIDYDNH